MIQAVRHISSSLSNRSVIRWFVHLISSGSSSYILNDTYIPFGPVFGVGLSRDKSHSLVLDILFNTHGGIVDCMIWTYSYRASYRIITENG